MSDKTNFQPSILLLSSDLFFTSKITTTAKAMGVHVDVRAGIPDEMTSSEGGDYRMVIIDLADVSILLDNVMAALPERNRPRLVAFGPHVAKVRLQAAKDAGCDEVMPRSRFSANLEYIMRSVLRR